MLKDNKFFKKMGLGSWDLRLYANMINTTKYNQIVMRSSAKHRAVLVFGAGKVWQKALDTALKTHNRAGNSLSFNKLNI